jgi:hypothetical protein
LKEKALDRTMWRARFGIGFGPVVRQTTKWKSQVSPAVKRIRLSFKTDRWMHSWP